MLKLKNKLAENTKAPFDVVVYDTEPSAVNVYCEIMACPNLAKYILVLQMRDAYELYNQQPICTDHAKHIMKGINSASH